MIESIQTLLNRRCGQIVLTAVGSKVRNKLQFTIFGMSFKCKDKTETYAFTIQ